jgi:hypothetical protein
MAFDHSFAMLANFYEKGYAFAPPHFGSRQVWLSGHSLTVVNFAIRRIRPGRDLCLLRNAYADDLAVVF